MNIERRKKIIVSILINCFVDDYAANKKIVDKLNQDMKNAQIPYNYTYDDFCIDFLKSTMATIQYSNLFNLQSYDTFVKNLSNFNKKTIQSMFVGKFIDFCIK